MDNPTSLWDLETPVKELGYEVPCWIDQDIDGATIAAIEQGGCASGAYMPAVTYHQALATMSEHGDAVMDYIDEVYGDSLGSVPRRMSWPGLACHFLSLAVDLWAGTMADEIRQSEGLE